nr:hypothetical protein [Tanacetum cinerariifolium]
MCHIIGIEPQFENIISNGPFVPMKAGQRKPEAQWTADERKVANLDQRLKSLIMSVLPYNQINSVINCLTTKSTWDDLILYHEGPSDVKENRVMDLKLCYNTFKFNKVESLTQTFTRYKALMNELVNDGINLSKLEINTGFINELPKKWLSFCQSLRNTNHVKDSELASLFDTPDDEEDTRSSHEYLNDLEEEYQSKTLLAKSKRFFKNGTQRFSSAKATDQTKCHKCGKKGQFARDCWSKNSVPSYQSPFQPKLFLSSENISEMRNTKDFEAKYNKDKAKLALLNSSALALSLFSSKNKDNSDMSITRSNLHKSFEAEDSTLPNHDADEVPSNKSQRNTIDPLAVVSNSPAPDYDSTDESSVCSTPLLPLKKLDGAEPGNTLNEPSSTPTGGSKSSSASKTNSAPAGKEKLTATTSDHNDIEWFRKRETPHAKKDVSSNALISKTPTKRKPFTKSPNMYQEYLAEFWYSTKALENSKVFFSIPTGDVVRRWFPTIGYGEEVSTKGTLRNTLLPPRWRFLMAQIIQCLGGKTSGFDQITNKDAIMLYSLANGIHINKEATKGESSKAPTGSKTSHSKRRKESSSAMDSNASQPLVSTPVDTEMHKEDQQATCGPTSLGVTSEERANPQLGNDFTAEVDPGISTPNDSIPPQQGMDEGTKNTSYDHISVGTDPHVLADQTKSVSEGLEIASSTIKLEDLAKLVSKIQPSFKDLDSPEDDPVIIVDESDEDDPNAKTEDTSSQKHKLELEKNKAEAALLKAQPSFPNVEQLNELLVKSLQTEFSKILSSHDFSSSLPTELKDLPSKFNELTEEIKGLKTQVHELEIELPKELKEIPTKLEDFTKTATSLTPQVTELKTL